MAYYNRREQLIRTLNTIRQYGEPEIIVVDDASTERIDDLGVSVIHIEPKDKWWLNPCIAYNMGFAQASGDIVIIQNPECLHTGDILKYCERLTEGTMFSFAAYSMDRSIAEYPQLPGETYRRMALNEPQRCQISHHGWYNHSVYRPVGYHFCNAIFRADLQKIGGFDERFGPGVARDDDEILLRIKRAGINVQIIDDPFVIHQKHERTDYRKLVNDRQRNENLYNQVLNETCVKPPQNKIYGK
jgi:glycosyltransferase involved in cell wall biosynthesis